MAGRRNDIDIKLNLDSKDAQRQLKDAAKAAGDLDTDLEEVETAGQAMARAIEQSTADMIDEIDRTKRAVDAMETALGDVDMDPREVVADLKRVGLTAEDIEADADELARALRGVGEVETHAARQGFDDVKQAVGGVADESGRARDVASGFTGGMIGELPLVEGALGPVAEGMGQLAEGALDGQIGFRQLIGAAAGFGAVAFGVQKINEKFERMKRIDALRKDQVDDYASALRDAASELEAMVTHFQDVEEFTFDNFALEGDAVRRGFVELGLTAEVMAGLVEGGESAVDEWAEAMVDAGNDADDVAIAARILNDQIDITTKGAENAALAMKFAGEETEIYNTAIDRAARTSQEMDYWSNQVASRMGDVEGAARDAEAELSELDRIYNELVEGFGEEVNLNNLQNEILAVKERYEEAKVAAEEGGTAAVTAANDAETAWLNAKTSLAEFIRETDEIPDDLKVTMLAEIDTFTFDQINAYLANLQRGVNIPIRAYVAPTSSNPDAGFGGGGNYVPPGGGGPMASRPTSVTYNIDARGSSPAQVAAEIERRRRLDQ